MCKDLMNTEAHFGIMHFTASEIRLCSCCRALSFGRTPGPAQRGDDVQSLLREEHLESQC